MSKFVVLLLMVLLFDGITSLVQPISEEPGIKQIAEDFMDRMFNNTLTIEDTAKNFTFNYCIDSVGPEGFLEALSDVAGRGYRKIGQKSEWDEEERQISVSIMVLAGKKKHQLKFMLKFVGRKLLLLSGKAVAWC